MQSIEESMQKIENYLGNSIDDHARELYITNEMVQDAVLRRMETLSDAASKLSRDLKDRHPNIHWRDITDFRNILAHAYMDLENKLVWEIITKSLPILREIIRAERVKIINENIEWDE